MKVLLLVHEALVPPEKYKNKSDWESAEDKTEYDIRESLMRLGHKVLVLGVGDELRPIKQAIDEFKPRVIFNLLEEFAGEAIFDQNVVSYLQMLKQKYTGCSPRGLIVARDKALAKKIMTYHRIPTPEFYTIKKKARIRIPKKMNYPLFVKTLNEEASLGIAQDSIVNDELKLIERVQYLRKKYNADVIVETYIDGRELYVSLMGNHKVKVFPPLELHFKNLPESAPKIATSNVKWNLSYRKKYGIKTAKAKLDSEIERKITKICRRAYKVLGLSGCARMDMRLTEAGQVYIIEANPNPDIGYKEEFADCASFLGIEYDQMVSKLLKLAILR